MATGLEVRVPFCDHRIVEYAFNMPWELKALHGREKGIVRAAFADALPPGIVERKKSPYPKTYDPAYEAHLTRKFQSVLEDPSAPVHRFLDPEKARRFLRSPKDLGKPWFGQLMAGPQMIAYMLQVNDWMTFYQLG